MSFSKNSEIRSAADAAVVDLDPMPGRVERAHSVVNMSSSAPMQPRRARNYSSSNLMLMLISVGTLSMFAAMGVFAYFTFVGIQNKDSSGSGVIDRPDAPMTESMSQSASQALTLNPSASQAWTWSQTGSNSGSPSGSGSSSQTGSNSGSPSGSGSRSQTSSSSGTPSGSGSGGYTLSQTQTGTAVATPAATGAMGFPQLVCPKIYLNMGNSFNFTCTISGVDAPVIGCSMQTSIGNQVMILVVPPSYNPRASTGFQVLYGSNWPADSVQMSEVGAKSLFLARVNTAQNTVANFDFSCDVQGFGMIRQPICFFLNRAPSPYDLCEYGTSASRVQGPFAARLLRDQEVGHASEVYSPKL